MFICFDELLLQIELSVLISLKLVYFYTNCNKIQIVLFLLSSWLLPCQFSTHWVLYFCYYFCVSLNCICLYFRILLMMLSMCVFLCSFYFFLDLITVYVSLLLLFVGVIPYRCSVSCCSFMMLGWVIRYNPLSQLFFIITFALTLCLAWPYDVVWLLDITLFELLLLLCDIPFLCFITKLYVICHFSVWRLLI